MIAWAEAGFADGLAVARPVARAREGVARPREARGWQGGVAGAECEANPSRVPI